LREILAEFDDDCRKLSASDSRLIRHELAGQIEHELLRFADLTKRAVLAIALKHFDDD
jgi:Fe-S-cluster formation regulator IscX/YfhJ